MSPAKWAKEYEIDATALYGQKVFPEIITYRAAIVVPEPYPEIPKSAVCWGGFDFGQRNPSSFHVYTILDSIIYSVWELYEPCRSVPDFAGKMKACPYWSQIRYIAADPSMWNVTKVNRFGSACSTTDLFHEQGVTRLLRGTTDEAAWIAQMRQHWANEAAITFKIYACCQRQISEFESAIFATMSDRLLATSNYKEEIADHNNHSLDDCKYLMLSRPRLAKAGAKLPEMYKKWLMKW